MVGFTYKTRVIIKKIINDDANWMSYLDTAIKLNEINIPGTHDSGTYSIA